MEMEITPQMLTEASQMASAHMLHLCNKLCNNKKSSALPDILRDNGMLPELICSCEMLGIIGESRLTSVPEFANIYWGYYLRFAGESYEFDWNTCNADLRKKGCCVQNAFSIEFNKIKSFILQNGIAESFNTTELSNTTEELELYIKNLKEMLHTMSVLRDLILTKGSEATRITYFDLSVKELILVCLLVMRDIAEFCVVELYNRITANKN